MLNFRPESLQKYFCDVLGCEQNCIHACLHVYVIFAFVWWLYLLLCLLFDCCIVFIVVCLYCLDWTESIVLRWKECVSNDDFQGKWHIHKIPITLTICMLVVLFLEKHDKCYSIAMQDLFRIEFLIPMCLESYVITW